MADAKIPKKVTTYDVHGDYIAIYFDDELKHYYHRPQLSEIFGWLGIEYESHDLPEPFHEIGPPDSHAEFLRRLRTLEQNQLDAEIAKKRQELDALVARRNA